MHLLNKHTVSPRGRSEGPFRTCLLLSFGFGVWGTCIHGFQCVLSERRGVVSSAYKPEYEIFAFDCLLCGRCTPMPTDAGRLRGTTQTIILKKMFQLLRTNRMLEKIDSRKNIRFDWQWEEGKALWSVDYYNKTSVSFRGTWSHSVWNDILSVACPW